MSRFSYRDECYKLSQECFQLNRKVRMLEGMLDMAIYAAVYTAYHNVKGQGMEGSAQQTHDELTAAIKQWAERYGGSGPPSSELELLVSKLNQVTLRKP